MYYFLLPDYQKSPLWGVGGFKKNGEVPKDFAIRFLMQMIAYDLRLT